MQLLSSPGPTAAVVSLRALLALYSHSVATTANPPCVEVVDDEEDEAPQHAEGGQGELVRADGLACASEEARVVLPSLVARVSITICSS